MSDNHNNQIPLSRYAQLAGREIHWLEWGAEDAPVVIAWHGLARTGRDMDEDRKSTRLNSSH